MGKNLIQQRRGRGTPTYRGNRSNYKGEVKHYSQDTKGVVVRLVHCPVHSAPLIEVAYLTGEKGLSFAPEGIKIGDEIDVGSQVEAKEGNVLPLKDIPEGAMIHNIELIPGDGGKLARAGGTSARIISNTEKAVRIKLPSSKEKDVSPLCRAAMGIVSGSGRLEKPFLKAGTRWKKMRARNKLYPRVCGISMNAVDHPFGGKCSHIKGRPTQCARNDPPGRKVGKIAPRRTGRKK